MSHILAIDLGGTHYRAATAFAADPELVIAPSHCREFFDIDSREVRRL